MNATAFVIPVPPQAAIPVAGEQKSFPVRRIWCVGRNYLEHIREMGNDERDQATLDRLKAMNAR